MTRMSLAVFALAASSPTAHAQSQLRTMSAVWNCEVISIHPESSQLGRWRLSVGDGIEIATHVYLPRNSESNDRPGKHPVPSTVKKTGANPGVLLSGNASYAVGRGPYQNVYDIRNGPKTSDILMLSATSPSAYTGKFKVRAYAWLPKEFLKIGELACVVTSKRFE